MTARILGVAVVPFLLFATGCINTHTYTVAVQNDTNRPLTVGLAKEGLPVEDDWMAPEELARNPSPYGGRQWGVAIPPGHSGDIGPVKMEVGPGGSQAWLRVYRGDLPTSELLAVSRGSPSRLDLPLPPGENDFVIFDRNGRLAARRNGKDVNLND